MKNINLFAVKRPIIDTSLFTNVLHDPIVTEVENRFAKLVGAKYAVSANSASMLIYIYFKHVVDTPTPRVLLPGCYPPVVVSYLLHANAKVTLDWQMPDTWVGNEHKLYVHPHEGFTLIDSAQAIGANVYSRSLNRSGFPEDCMLFSFYPTKPCGGLDGGMLVTDSKEVADEVRRYINYGHAVSGAQDSWSKEWDVPGYKAYMSATQALAINLRLDSLEQELKRLDVIRFKYQDSLLYSKIKVHPGSFSSNHLFRVKTNIPKCSISMFREELRAKGIPTGIHYNPLTTVLSYEFLTKINTGDQNLLRRKFPTDKTEWISIPFHSELADSEVDYILRTMKCLEQ